MVAKNSKFKKVFTLRFPKNWKKEIGFSQTILKMYMECDFKLLFQLNRWGKPGKEENFFYGECCHEILDVIYTSGHRPTPLKISRELDKFLEKKRNRGELDWIKDQKLEYYKTIILVVMGEYFKVYKKDFGIEFIQVEENFNVKWKGFRLTGKRDGVIKKKIKKKNKKLLLEHKTKTYITEEHIEQELELNFQNFYYMLSYFVETGKWLDGVLYNVIRKPSIKPANNESLKSFAKRLKEDINKRPDFYFKRWDVEYTKKQRDLFQVELFEIFSGMKKMLDGKRIAVHNRAICNTGYQCEYLEACSSGILKGYTQRKELSPELQ